MITKNFCSSLFNIVGKLGEKETVAITGVFNGHIESNADDYEDQHGYGYRFRKNRGERTLKFCAAVTLYDRKEYNF